MKTSRLLIWLLGLHPVVCSSLEASLEDEYILTNESEEDGLIPKRVSIPSFQLELSPTFAVLSEAQEQALEDACNTVLEAYIPDKVDFTLDYIRLVNVVKDESSAKTIARRDGGGFDCWRLGELSWGRTKCG